MEIYSLISTGRVLSGADATHCFNAYASTFMYKTEIKTLVHYFILIILKCSDERIIYVILSRFRDGLDLALSMSTGRNRFLELGWKER